jgi:hypothetical protein
MPPKFAPHVAQAIGRAAGGPGAAQAKPGPPAAPGAARHVAQAVAQAKARPAQAPPAQGARALQRQEDEDPGRQQKEAFAKLNAARGAPSDYVAYPDLKTGGAPPPPPRRQVFSLSCEGGGQCRLQDVKTGRQSDAGDLWGGFVRMSKRGPVYVSPRSGLGGPGDSHPSIASVTPEGMAGRRSVVAAGEIGILGGAIVGHNDKTGHFQSRKNRRQSGLPADLYHPFTEDPREWYHS